MSNYVAKQELENATGVDTCSLTAKRDFVALKAEVDKLDNNKLINAPNGLNNLKTKVDDLDVDMLKTFPVDLEKVSYILSKELAKNTLYNTLNIKVNNLESKIPDPTTLIHINEYNTDKQKLEKKMVLFIKKIPEVSGLVTSAILNTKIAKVDNKMSDTSGSATTTVLDIKIEEVENKIPDFTIYSRK